LRALYNVAIELGLDVLVESHTESELETALGLDRAIIGVNSRDLQSLKTDLDTARRLSREIPAERLAVAESGIRCRADIIGLEEAGYNAFLVGEMLMKSASPDAKLRELQGLVANNARKY
ncbi:MAG: indole-3-glycerol-phosphate synthase TrpC, partial [Lentisphaerae bacterium]|nr:indole-3-glycerol-phosphate synthase TrpC [Lentisphaerota bacterium]